MTAMTSIRLKAHVMTIRTDLKFRWICNAVKTHFDFLFQRGFRIVSVMFTDQGNEDWQVMMSQDDDIVVLRCVCGRISLGLSTAQLYDRVGFLGLGVFIRGAIPIPESHTTSDAGWDHAEGQIEEIALLFGKHFNNVFLRFHQFSILPLDRLPTSSKIATSG
jgi:hypothetical protein